MTHVAKTQSWVVRIVIASMVFASFSAMVLPVQAAALTNASDTMGREKISTESTHKIIFTTPSGVASGGSIIVTFPTDFDASNVTNGPLDFSDLDLFSNTDCTTGPQTLAASSGASQWGVTVASPSNGPVFTITSGGPTISAASGVCILIGVNATGGASNSNIKNATTTGSKTIALNAGADSASIAVPMVDDDQVSITATVDPSITFDLDTSIVDGESTTPYSVSLGTLSSGTLTTSNQTTINSIFIDLDTNAAHGASVTVKGANVGLTSVAASKTITLPAVETTIAAGDERVGLCVESVSETSGGPLVKGTQYDSGGGACSLTNTGTQVVGQIETIPTEIFNTTAAAIAGGRGEVLVKASVSGTTPAANDYANTLTFIATGTF